MKQAILGGIAIGILGGIAIGVPISIMAWRLNAELDALHLEILQTIEVMK